MDSQRFLGHVFPALKGTIEDVRKSVNEVLDLAVEILDDLSSPNTPATRQQKIDFITSHYSRKHGYGVRRSVFERLADEHINRIYKSLGGK